MNRLGTQPRTWTLRASSPIYARCAAVLESNGPSMAKGERIEVIELEPVLDLMERVKGRSYGINEFLRAHGRLK